MGGKSSSTATQATSSSTTASETNLNASGNTGTTVVGGGPVSSVANSNNQTTSTISDSGNTSNVTYNTVTDQGALLAGTQLGSEAIAANTGLTETLATNSTNFADHALDVVSANQTQSANLVSQVLQTGAQFLTTTESQIASIETNNQNAANAQLANTATTLGNIAAANDTTAAAQSTAFAQNVLKYGAIALLGVGALIVIYAVVKK